MILLFWWLFNNLHWVLENCWTVSFMIYLLSRWNSCDTCANKMTCVLWTFCQTRKCNKLLIRTRHVSAFVPLLLYRGYSYFLLGNTTALYHKYWFVRHYGILEETCWYNVDTTMLVQCWYNVDIIMLVQGCCRIRTMLVSRSYNIGIMLLQHWDNVVTTVWKCWYKVATTLIKPWYNINTRLAQPLYSIRTTLLQHWYNIASTLI